MASFFVKIKKIRFWLNSMNYNPWTIMVSIKFLSALSSLVGAESCVIMTKVPLHLHFYSMDMQEL